MRLVIKHEVNPVRGGYLARSTQMRVAAQGYNEQTAKANLERTVQLFLAPLEREGILQEELRKMGVTFEEIDGSGLVILLS